MSVDQSKTAHAARLKNLRIFDDIFMSKIFDGDIACIELILQIILDKPDLRVKEVSTQVTVSNFLHKSTRFDIIAEDSLYKLYNVEFQRASKGSSPKRARFNSSMLDARALRRGKDYKTLPESYVIFITESDVMELGLPVYLIERYVVEKAALFDDGSHILYVNGSFCGDLKIGKLMHDLFCSDPAEMHFPALAERVRYYKEQEEGISMMYETFDQELEAIAEKTRLDTIIELYLKNKLSAEDAAESASLSVEEFLQLVSNREQ